MRSLPRYLLSCSFVIVFIASTAMASPRFYSVDVSTDELVIVDATGDVTVVGPLGQNVDDIDLAI